MREWTSESSFIQSFHLAHLFLLVQNGSVDGGRIGKHDGSRGSLKDEGSWNESRDSSKDTKQLLNMATNFRVKVPKKCHDYFESLSLRDCTKSSVLVSGFWKWKRKRLFLLAASK